VIVIVIVLVIVIGCFPATVPTGLVPVER